MLNCVQLGFWFQRNIFENFHYQNFSKLFDCSNLGKVKVSTKEEEAEIRALIAAQSGKQHAGNQFSFEFIYIVFIIYES